MCWNARLNPRPERSSERKTATIRVKAGNPSASPGQASCLKDNAVRMSHDHDLPPLQATPTGLYRHYKGGWYSVLDTVRCSETLQAMTLYRALYGAGGLWVRPASMFSETGLFDGREQARFVPHDPALVPLSDLATARALVAHLRHSAQVKGLQLDVSLRPAPPEPTTCCGRGCNGCVWEGFYEALHHWRAEALALLQARAGPC